MGSTFIIVVSAYKNIVHNRTHIMYYTFKVHVTNVFCARIVASPEMQAGTVMSKEVFFKQLHNSAYSNKIHY